MNRDDTDEPVTVEVSLPRELLRDLDRYATLHGYTSQDAVVREALGRK